MTQSIDVEAAVLALRCLRTNNLDRSSWEWRAYNNALAAIDALTQRAEKAERERDEARAEVEKLNAAIKRQAAAVRTLHHNEQSEVNQLRAKARDEYQATKTLDSERKMNAILTEELDQAQDQIASMQVAIAEAVRRADTYKNAMHSYAYQHITEPLRPFIVAPEPAADPLVEVAREMTLLDGIIRTDNQKAAIRSGKAGQSASEDFCDRLRTALAARGLEVRKIEGDA